MLPILISLHTGCSSRHPQDRSQVLWCHVLLYSCQPVSTLCGKPAAMPRSVAEEDEGCWGGITSSPFLQVTKSYIVLTVVTGTSYYLRTNSYCLSFNFFWSQRFAVRVSLHVEWHEEQTSGAASWWVGFRPWWQRTAQLWLDATAASTGQLHG